MADTNTTVRVAIEAITSNAESGFKRVGDMAGGLAGRINAAAEASRNLSPGVQAFKQGWEDLSPVLTNVSSLLLKIGAGSIGALVAGTKTAGEWAHTIQDGAAALGVTEQRYQALAKVAAKHAIDPAQFNMAAVGIARMLKAANDPGSAMGREKASALKSLGLDPATLMKDGEDSIALVGNVMKKLATLKGTDRAAAAAELGISGRMLKMLKLGDIEAEMGKTSASPTFLTDKQLEDLDKAYMAQRKLGATIVGTWRLVWAEAGPVVTKFYERLAGIVEVVARFVRDNPGMTRFFTNVAAYGGGAAVVLGTLIKGFVTLGGAMVNTVVTGARVLAFLRALRASEGVSGAVNAAVQVGTAGAAESVSKLAKKSAASYAERAGLFATVKAGEEAFGTVAASASGAATSGGLAAAAAAIMASPVVVAAGVVMVGALAAYSAGKIYDIVKAYRETRAENTRHAEMAAAWNADHPNDMIGTDDLNSKAFSGFAEMYARSKAKQKRFGGAYDGTGIAIAGPQGESLTSAPAGANAAVNVEYRADMGTTNQYLAQAVELLRTLVNKAGESANAARFAPMAARSYAYPY